MYFAYMPTLIRCVAVPLSLSLPHPPPTLKQSTVAFNNHNSTQDLPSLGKVEAAG